MNRWVVAGVVVLLTATSGMLFVGGLAPGVQTGGPPDGATPAANDASTESTPPSSDDVDGSAAATTTTASTPSEPDYDFAIQRVANCGMTCRDVTARLANAGSQTRENVRVTTKVYADGDLLWTGKRNVGALAPGEADTLTKRVDVGLSGAMKIRNNGGYVTIVTVVRSDGATTRFSERRKAA